MYRKVQFSVLILILALVGCRTNRAIKADNTIQAMSRKFDAFKRVPDKVTATISSLNELVKGGGDMRANFRTFDRDVDNLIRHRDRFSRWTANVDSSKSAFVDAWAERQLTINSDELRARSRERRAAVIAHFDKVNELVAETKAEFEPWLNKVIDIRTYLESDLTPGGVHSIADLVPPLSREARNVNSKIADLIAEIDKLSASMTPTRP